MTTQMRGVYACRATVGDGGGDGNDPRDSFGELATGRGLCSPASAPLVAELDYSLLQAYLTDNVRRVTFFLPDDLEAGLKALKVEHGTPEAESMRRAITAYLREKGVLRQSDSKTAPVKRRQRD